MGITRATISLKSEGGFNPNFVDMTINQINIYVGTNGSGKSFILRQTFILGFLGLSYHGALVLGQPIDMREFANFVLSKAYVDPDFTGVVNADFDNGAFIEYKMEKGVVTSCVVNNVTKETKPFPHVVFLSAEMRTFDDISGYLRMRKRIVGPSKVLNDNQFKELCEEFKIYDVLYLERMINGAPINMEKMEFDRFNIKPIKTIDVDLEKCDWYTEIEGDLMNSPGPGEPEPTRKWMRTYSKGEQSLINMFSANFI
jgi:hypothetical protein